MLAKTYGAAVMGVDAHVVTIEVSVVRGLYLFMSGLPDKAVKESEHRIHAALSDAGYYKPRSRVIINLAPADMRKEGSAYDLPLALGILHASRQEKLHFTGRMIMGELSLDGKVLPLRGVLSMALAARNNGFEELIIPKANAQEAAVIEQLKVVGVETLAEAIEYVSGRITLAREYRVASFQKEEGTADFADVQGQENMKRALEIAAAGGHNVILIGPPGAGKTMLARRIGSILPPLTVEEAIETTKVHSIARKLAAGQGLMVRRPFRSPHHTTSDVALVGGGGFPMPGEISLAHNGVLFLDELPEFRRNVLEVMRQPMEERKVTISRAQVSVDYPASFMLIASMNPCPCGYYNHPSRDCSCLPGAVKRYLNKISGPLLDRIDLHLEVTPVALDCVIEQRSGEPSSEIRARVENARTVQSQRFGNSISTNAMMTTHEMQMYCRLDDGSRKMIRTALENLGLSARAYDRILKVSRTIADLENSRDIRAHHLAEAIQYRSLDRESWGG